MSVAGLLLAGGAGRRYGMPKALVPHGDQLSVEHALTTLRSGFCDPVVVVVGAAAEEVIVRADLSHATVVVNKGWAEGMGSSLRAGLGALFTTPAMAVVVLLVDTPGITDSAVRRVSEHARPEALAVATYDGERGHPVLLGRAHWTGVVARAVGDIGAREYLAERVVTLVSCDGVADGVDVDEPSALGGHRIDPCATRLGRS